MEPLASHPSLRQVSPGHDQIAQSPGLVHNPYSPNLAGSSATNATNAGTETAFLSAEAKPASGARSTRPKPRAYSSALQEAVPGVLASARPSKPVPKPRSRSSVVSRSKLRQTSFSSDGSGPKPLNTHSPIAVAAAAAVTADKIRRLLSAQGPLPIRHITSHLAATIAGFGELSLSKQRRLIIAVLDGPKSGFVKVGWGRWAVGGQEISAASVLRPQFSNHRESISRQLPDSKPPLSPSLGPAEESAVFSDSESSEFDDDSEVEGTDEEDWQAIGPAQLRRTSPREQDAIAALVQLRSN